MPHFSTEGVPRGTLWKGLKIDKVLSPQKLTLGRKLYEWTYVPTLRDKAMAFLPVLATGALLALLLYLGRDWKRGDVLKHVLQALVGIGGGFAAQRVWGAFRKRAYELYEAGYVERDADGDGKQSDLTVRYWKDIRDCQLVENGVRLIVGGIFRLSSLLRVRGAERFVVYNLCREQIVRARSQASEPGTGSLGRG